MEKFASDRLTKLGFIVLGAVTAVYALTTLALPFGWDHGMMASVGNSYVHGKLPYVDSWDLKGPLAYVPYALVQLMFGPTMWGIRLFDIIFSALTGWTFYKAAGALTTWRVGAWAALALYYWIAAAGWFFTAAPDPWIGSLCVMAVMPLLTPNEPLRVWRFVLAGFFIGCAGLMKPPYLLVGIAPLLSIMLNTAATVWLRAIEVHILYPFSTYAALNVSTNPLQGFATFFAQPTVALLAPFAALGAWSVRRRPQTLWPMLSWLAATVLIVAMQGKYFFQHWLPVYAPLLLLSVLGAHRLASVKEEAPRLAASAAALVFAAQVCAPPLYGAAKCVYYLAVKRAPETYYASFQFQNYNAADEQAAARYIRARTDSADGVFVWGNDATIRYLADRPNPSRFTFEMPLSLRGPYLDRYRTEAMHDLLARAPVYFVVGVNWWTGDTKEQSLAKFPAMAAFLKQDYSLEKSFGVIDIYRRNGIGRPISFER